MEVYLFHHRWQYLGVSENGLYRYSPKKYRHVDWPMDLGVQSGFGLPIGVISATAAMGRGAAAHLPADSS